MLFTVRQLLKFQYITCYCLSEEFGFTNKLGKEFQYITCYCLSVLLYPPRSVKPSFNTSHVTVYHIPVFSRPPKYRRFNTSHVTVYRRNLILKICKLTCFNTSHVTVYHERQFQHRKEVYVSIHHMLLFIFGKIFMSWYLSRFNTSHVTVYQSYGIGLYF